MSHVIVNGEPSTACAVEDRGLQFGDGLFETMLCLAGTPVDIDLHWNRLSLGCERLGIACPPVRARMLADIAEHGGPRAVAKLIVTRGNSQRGYHCAPETRPNWVLRISKAPEVPRSVYEQGVDVTVCRTRLSVEDPLLAGMKHLNRLPQVLARREWNDEYHDGLLTNPCGQVVEGCASNLFIARGGALITPDLSLGGVEGIVRQRVLSQARLAGIACEVRAVELAELDLADEVFLTNSIYGIVPVRSVRTQRYAVGPVTQALLRHIARGVYF